MPLPAARAGADALLRSAEPDLLVTFTGGEPLLAFPLIRSTVRYIERRRHEGQTVRYRLATNGLLLERDNLQFLVDHRFELQVSVDGPEPIHTLRSPGAYPRLDALLDGLHRNAPRYLGEYVTLAATVTPSNVARLGETVRHLLSLGTASVAFGPVMGIGRIPHAAVAELDRQMGLVAESARLEQARTGTTRVAAFRGIRQATRGRRTEVCSATSRSTLVVDADGRWSTCLMATRTYAPQPPPALRAIVGALRSLGALSPGARLSDADTGALNALRADAGRYSVYGRCSRCRWKQECRVCPLSAVGESHWADPLRVPAFVCGFNRTLLKHRERFLQRHAPTHRTQSR